MGQMNVSLTTKLTDYIRGKVKNGSYNNASEVVREALRLMELEEQRSLRLAEPTIEDILADLDSIQLAGIQQKVLAGIQDIEAGRVTEYHGKDGLNQLVSEIQSRGRKRLSDLKLRASAD